MLNFNAVARREFPPVSVTTSESNAQEIASTISPKLIEGGEECWNGGEISWLLNREVETITTVASIETGFMSDPKIILRKFVLEDPGTFALRRQMQVEEQLRALYGMTTGIDLSRPTQD